MIKTCARQKTQGIGSGPHPEAHFVSTASVSASSVTVNLPALSSHPQNSPTNDARQFFERRE
jgi:hypothetical protein